MESAIVLSHYQTRALLADRRARRTAALISPDLGLTTVEVSLRAEGVIFPAGLVLGWGAVAEIDAAENACFAVSLDGELHRIAAYSEQFGRAYSLMPTEGAPTMLISGIPMHRIKGTDPHRDTLEKIKAVKPVAGRVLDTATGLGYTAIEAARTAEHVITVELDPTALEICRQNPWSAALFDNPRIEQRIGDSFDVVAELPDGAFARVIHDPPAFALAGHLYSTEFYGELHRALAPRGRLFHYVGNPESKSGHTVTAGVIRRLREAGFLNIEPRPQAFGVVAGKGTGR